MIRPWLHVDTKVHVLEEGRHVRVVEAGVVEAKDGWLELQGIRGLVNNSVLFCWLFTIKGRCRKVRLQQHKIKVLRQVLLTVSQDLCVERTHTWRCPFISEGPVATHEGIRWPLKGTVSAQKNLQGSETETRDLLGGTEGKKVSQWGMGSLICPPGKSMSFTYLAPYDLIACDLPGPHFLLSMLPTLHFFPFQSLFPIFHKCATLRAADCDDAGLFIPPIFWYHITENCWDSTHI